MSLAAFTATIASTVDLVLEFDKKQGLDSKTYDLIFTMSDTSVIEKLGITIP